MYNAVGKIGGDEGSTAVLYGRQPVPRHEKHRGENHGGGRYNADGQSDNLSAAVCAVVLCLKLGPCLLCLVVGRQVAQSLAEGVQQAEVVFFKTVYVFICLIIHYQSSFCFILSLSMLSAFRICFFTVSWLMPRRSAAWRCVLCS
ncbi:unknown [Prevotella sp. CAG:1124]|nr:unknown [Prevotella sp. CAG:1124]